MNRSTSTEADSGAARIVVMLPLLKAQLIRYDGRHVSKDKLMALLTREKGTPRGMVDREMGAGPLVLITGCV